MSTREQSGTVTPTVATPSQVPASAITTSKAFQGSVNITNLAAGEYVEIKVFRKVLTTGSAGVMFSEIYSWLDALVTPVVTTPPTLATGDYYMTVNQLNGSARAFDWDVETP